MFRMIGVLTLTMLSSALAAQPVDRDEQRQWLLEQVRIGEALHRDDLVHNALARLNLLEPSNPDALLAALTLALREHNAEQAERLGQRLSQAAPGSRQERQARSLLRLQQPDQAQRLQQARLFAVTGRYEEALVAYDQLFAGDPPTLDLALDYWRAVGSISGRRTQAISQLQQLDKHYPGYAGLRQTLANWLFSEGRDSEALAILDQLSRDPSARDAAAQREFDYLAEQPVSAASVTGWQAFRRRYPASPLLPLADENLSHQRTLVGDPAWQAGQRGKALLEQERNVEAEAQLRVALRRYADDASLNGALGVALMRQRRYAEANSALRQAATLEQDTSLISKWKDLQASSQYWGMLQKADSALAKQDLQAARRLYQQARRQRPDEAFALLGLADVSFAEGDTAAAERQYLQVRRMEPDNSSAVRGLMRVYQAHSTDKVEAYLNSLPAAQQAQFEGLRRSLELDRLRQQADAAVQRKDWLSASQSLRRASELAPDEPWLVYQLANSLRQQGRDAEADGAFTSLVKRQPQDPPTRYAHGLYLESSDRDAQVRATLQAIAPGAWTDDMRNLDQRVRRRMTLAQAQRLQEQGHTEQATAVLEAALAQGDGSPDDLLLMADWAARQGDHVKARGYYQRVLKVQPQRPEARLGVMESWVAEGDLARVRQDLEAHPLSVPEQGDAQQRLAAIWAALGERDKAARLLEQVAAHQPQPDPVLRRDAARLVATDDPQRALDLYAAAMADAQLLAPSAVSPRDDRAMTYASRAKDEDDWLLRSLRSDVDELYQQRNTNVTLQHDYGWRKSDGTPGISRLSSQATLLHIDTPWEDGRAFARLERIGLDAGSFDLDENGQNTEDFGTCQFVGVTRSGAPLPTCQGGSQTANGGVLAMGWQNERWGFDLGTTQGYEVNNWLGGAIVNGDLGQVGWSLAASRRPMSNSLLSFAGTRDPATGIRWGGVTANGATLGLSWDEGGDHGIWASLGHHWLLGENVADNQRTRAMAGYYYRLVEKSDERMRVGLTLMHWRYDKDLGGYSLGQGGYYSPQRYQSIGVPVSYAWRNYDWSFLLEGSVSWSRAHSDTSRLYPDEHLNRKLLDRYDIIDSNIDATVAASDSNGLGYRLHGLFERRLNDRWALGGGFDWQHSDDYAPSHAMLYVRYLFEPWRGNLALPVTPQEPYSEWR